MTNKNNLPKNSIDKPFAILCGGGIVACYIVLVLLANRMLVHLPVFERTGLIIVATLILVAIIAMFWIFLTPVVNWLQPRIQKKRTEAIDTDNKEEPEELPEPTVQSEPSPTTEVTPVTVTPKSLVLPKDIDTLLARQDLRPCHPTEHDGRKGR